MNLFTLSGVLIMISSGFMGALMFIIGKTKLHYLWGVFCVSVFLWGIGSYMIGTTDDIVKAEIWWRITHIGVIFIPILFTNFVYELLNLKNKQALILLYLIGVFFLIIDIKGDLLIAHMRFVFDQFYYDSPPGILYPLFTVFFFGLTFYSHAILWKVYRNSNDLLQKTRIRYLFVGMLISFSGGSLSFLPVYGVDVYPVFNTMIFIYPIIVGYAILKYKLFNVKIILTEALVFILWLLMLIELFYADTSREIFIGTFVLVLVFVLGIFLIKSVSNEVFRREQTEKLVSELREANEKLRELDQIKSDFISIASHQLRTPLTAIKGYTSMLLEGVYGDVPIKARGIVDKIFQSSQRLVYIVNDMLDVTRIEGGRLKYAFEDVRLVNLVNDVVEELRQNASRKKLKFNFHVDVEDADIIVFADPNKTRQAITNLIDNSIKYTNAGFVFVFISKSEDGKDAILAIKDSGLGMTPDTLNVIFNKFFRAKGALKSHTEGSGLGLYVAREIIRANNGDVWAESEGQGRGSQFYIKLPIKKG